MKRETRRTAKVVHYVILIISLLFTQIGFSQGNNTIEESTLNGLIKNLSSKDPVTRASAVYNIGEKGTAAGPAAAKLGNLLKDRVTVERSVNKGIFIDKAEKVTIGELAVEALWKIGPTTDDYLINALTDKKEAVRLNAIRGIKLIRHRMAASSFMDNPAYIHALLILLKDKNYKIRAAAVHLVGILPDNRLLDSLVPALYDKEMIVRSEAVLVFRCRKGGPKVTDGLINLCSRDQWESPFIALGRTGDPRAIPVLLAGLENRRAYCSSNNYNLSTDLVVSAIIYAMSLVDDKSTLQTLTTMFSGGSSQMRLMIVEALDHLDDPGSFELFMRAAQDTSMDVRRAAICALCRLGDRRAMPVFRDAIKDTHVAMQLVAVWALQRYGDHSADSLVRPIIRDFFQPMADTVFAKFKPADTLTIDKFILYAMPLYQKALYHKTVDHLNLIMNSEGVLLYDLDFFKPYGKLLNVIRWTEPREVLTELLTIAMTYPGEYAYLSPVIEPILKVPMPVDYEDLPFFIQYSGLK